ncbi:MAG: hypothetical protein HRK26_02940 [Rickettsiaceae bacterium H1]|nr:hypothetical protein [Rickettsiaceae bacterium H1]
MTKLFFSETEGAIGDSILIPIEKFIRDKLESISFGPNEKLSFENKLQNLNIQTSIYEKVIPIIYGTVKIAGNIIWALPIKK